MLFSVLFHSGAKKTGFVGAGMPFFKSECIGEWEVRTHTHTCMYV
jgi:hypothetical protein